jgi:hypothetical protein
LDPHEPEFDRECPTGFSREAGVIASRAGIALLKRAKLWLMQATWKAPGEAEAGMARPGSVADIEEQATIACNECVLKQRES